MLKERLLARIISGSKPEVFFKIKPEPGPKSPVQFTTLNFSNRTTIIWLI